MRQFLFIEGNLALELFVAPEDFNHDGKINVEHMCVVFPGIPSTFSKEFFGSKIKSGTAFLYVHYLGSWLSGGTSSPDSCRESVKLALDFMRNKEGKELFKNTKVSWSFEHLFVVGYSFAGNIILTSNILGDNISGVILYAPLIFIHEHDTSKVLTSEEMLGFEKSNREKLAFLRRGFSHAWKGIDDKKWDDYFSGKEVASEIRLLTDFPKVTVFHGTSDREVDPRFSQYFGKQFGAEVCLVPNAPHTKELLSNEHLSGFLKS